MSRCILVLGTGRSGTSAVAGVLYKLGVWMGDEFVARDRNSPHGTFEDAEFWRVTRGKASGQKIPEGYGYGPLVKSRQESRKIWGIKDPGLLWTFSELLPHLGDDVRIIALDRPKAECVASFCDAYDADEWQTGDGYDDTKAKLEASLCEFTGPVRWVNFHELLDEPDRLVGEIAAFAFDGMDPPSARQLRRAVAHIRRDGAPHRKGDHGT